MNTSKTLYNNYYLHNYIIICCYNSLHLNCLKLVLYMLFYTSSDYYTLLHNYNHYFEGV